MNTNSNLYTVIYTTVIVVVVAAVLAFVSQSLKSKQDANEKAETISQMLTAGGFGTKAEFQAMGNAKVLETYTENISKALLVDATGEVHDSLDLATAQIYTPKQLKAQNYLIKSGKDDEVRIPVFIFKNNIVVVPVYGAGLWGPIWGYIAMDPAGNKYQITGAYFDHESETAGLGAKIKDDPAFQNEFKGETPDWKGDKIFSIVKGGSPKNADGSEIADSSIDAITGATMTSNGLDAAINVWLKAYSAYLPKCHGTSCCGDGTWKCFMPCGEEHNANKEEE